MISFILNKLYLRIIPIICTIFLVIASCSKDIKLPSGPTGLAAGNITSSSFTLSLNASTGSFDITGYQVFRDGNSIGTTGFTSMPVFDLNANTTYSMAVRACDIAGNWSAKSSDLYVATASCGEISHGSQLTRTDVGTPGSVQFLCNNFVEGNSSALSLYAAYAPLENVLVKNNFFTGLNIGYGVNGGKTHDYWIGNHDIRFIGNRWRAPFYWGPVAAMKMDQPGTVWEENCWEDGTPILPREDI